MAFWGIEVRPGKPVTHKYDQVRGRLRVSQAALGLGSATNKSVVQCNIGDKSPVILCVLLPDKTESCHLDLEFEEADNVIFSVIGPRSVHITGYYSGGRRTIYNDSSESYGVDIANSDGEQSVHGSDEDSYDDSFINDDDPEVFSPSSFSSDIASDEEMSDKKKPKARKAMPKRLKKRYKSIESEDESYSQLNHKVDSVIISDDDDKAPISTLLRNKINEAEEKSEKGMRDMKAEHAQDNGVNNKKIDEKSSAKSKKKRKERTKETPEADGEIHKNSLKNEINLENGAEESLRADRKGDKTCEDSRPSNKSDPENEVRPKKKRKKSKEDGKTLVPDLKVENAHKEDILEQNNGNAQENGKEDQKLPHEKSNDIASNPVVEENQLNEKKSKKKKKNKSKEKEENEGFGVGSLAEGEKNKKNIGSNEKNVESKSSEGRTLSNGLIIEDLETGKPDGKIATSGKKIKVHFVGKLRDGGQIFDSNIGKSPFKFRLGAEGVTEGWNIGLDGMRVGGKRRLTIPPTIGDVRQGTGENIPPNSWLVYEFDLIEVR